MTKKDYEKAVDLIERYRDGAVGKAALVVLTNAFADFFHGDNPRFDEERFREAVEKRLAR